MFLRCTVRKKNGKEHRYYSLVENRRVSSGRVVQRPVLYLGENNDSQREAWRKTIEIFEEGQTGPRTVALFPEDRMGPVADADVVRIRLHALSLHRPRSPLACAKTNCARRANGRVVICYAATSSRAGCPKSCGSSISN